MAKQKKEAIDIEDVISRIITGDTYRKIANELNIPLSTLFDFIHKTEHSVRVREALEYSAETFADKAEQVLVDAKPNQIEIARARELSQFYKWKASKRSPKKFGDKLDVTSDNKPIMANVAWISNEPTKQ